MRLLYTPALGASFGYIDSKHFNINDFIYSDTATAKGIDNTPTSEYWPSLQALANMADKLYDTIGPFRIISGFRSQKLQEALGTAQAAKKSFHSMGIAMDIVPTTMTAEEYYFKILTSPIFNQLGEVAWKRDNNTTIHLSLGSSYGGKPPTPMVVIDDVYYPLSDADKALIFSKFKKAGIGLGVVALIAAASYFGFKAYTEGYFDEWFTSLKQRPEPASKPTS